MEVDAVKAAEMAREIATRKTAQRFPYPHHIAEKHLYFALESAKQFCDRVLPGGYSQLTHYQADTKGKL